MIAGTVSLPAMKWWYLTEACFWQGMRSTAAPALWRPLKKEKSPGVSERNRNNKTYNSTEKTKSMRILVLLFMCIYCIAAQVLDESPVDSSQLVIQQDGDSTDITDPDVLTDEKESGYEVVQHSVKLTGVLHVITDSHENQVFLDGEEVGKGSVMLDNVPIGSHTLKISNNKKSKEKNVFIVENQVRKVEIEIERSKHFVIIYSFSQFWYKRFNTFGPAINFGLQLKKYYIGVNFHWNLFDNTEYDSSLSTENVPAGKIYDGKFYGGAFLQCYYDALSLKEVFYLSPGICSGFWKFYGKQYRAEDPNTSISYTTHNQFFFLGVSIKTVGKYKRVFAICDYTLLVGTHVGNLLKLGIGFFIP